VRRMEQSGAGAGVRAFGDDFEGDLGQLRAYAPMITRWGGRLGGGRGGQRCDAKLKSRGYFSFGRKSLFCFELRRWLEVL
jgi:hypothetical protein